jgi:hypothetical protein
VWGSLKLVRLRLVSCSYTREYVYGDGAKTSDLPTNLHVRVGKPTRRAPGGVDRLEKPRPLIRRLLRRVWAGNPSMCCGLAETPASPQKVALELDGGDPDCLRTLGPLLDVELDPLVFLERFEAVALYF